MTDLSDTERDELEAYRAEDLREREWAASVRESDVRCYGCGLRYGERDQYSCDRYPRHEFDDDELATARRLDPPSIPRASA